MTNTTRYYSDCAQKICSQKENHFDSQIIPYSKRLQIRGISRFSFSSVFIYGHTVPYRTVPYSTVQPRFSVQVSVHIAEVGAVVRCGTVYSSAVLGARNGVIVSGSLFEKEFCVTRSR
jgi:hypothetical protein